MALEIINTPVTGIYGDSTVRTAKKELGKDDFLLLLTKQMQNQDPLKPMDNMEFVSQMANFTTLEQITNMGRAMDKFLTKTGDSYKTDSMWILGQTVTALPEGAVEPITGTVSSVKFVDGEAVFKIGDTELKMGDIQKIEIPTA